MTAPHSNPLLESYYLAYLKDQDSAAYAARVSRHYLPATLQRLLVMGRPAGRRAAALALGLVADFASNRALGRALSDRDRSVRLLAEESIRKVWRRQGTLPEQRELEAICQLNQEQRFDDALARANRLIEQAPAMAEAWNQRAIAQFRRGQLAEAIRDCHEALERNAYHFDAAAGMGQCFLQLGEAEAALDCLRRALRVNPNLEGVRAGVRYLERRGT